MVLFTAFLSSFSPFSPSFSPLILTALVHSSTQMSQILDNKYNFSRHQTHTFHTLGHTSARSVQKFYWRPMGNLVRSSPELGRWSGSGRGRVRGDMKKCPPLNPGVDLQARPLSLATRTQAEFHSLSWTVFFSSSLFLSLFFQSSRRDISQLI